MQLCASSRMRTTINTCNLTHSRDMYALYQQLKALVFGAEAAEAEEEAAGPPLVKPTRDEPQPPPQPQTRYFTGEITSLSGTSGMIDQQVCTDSVTCCSRDSTVTGLLYQQLCDG